MPSRSLTARQRSSHRDHLFGAVLAFIAGAVDVCGYVELKEFTSHVTGATASLGLGLAQLHAIAIPATILFSFIAGSAVSSVLILWIGRRGWQSEYALPTLLEAVLLAVLAVTASPGHRVLSLCVLALTMGLQNALITRLSNKEIRTTHVTAMCTDIGIQLGRALYRNRRRDCEPVRADSSHLQVLVLLVACFLAGGVFGAFATPHFGFRLLLLFAALLTALSARPIVADLRRA